MQPLSTVVVAGFCCHRKLDCAPVAGSVLEILKIIVTYQVDTIGDGSITTQSEKVGLSAFDLMGQGICEQLRVRTPFSLTQEWSFSRE